MADAAERSVPSTVRETVAAVEDLARDDILGEGVTQTQVAARLGVDKSTAQRRSRVAISRGFLRNLEARRGLPARLVGGDPLPDDRSLLPGVSELARLHGCMPDRRDELPVEVDYPRSAHLLDEEDDDLWSLVPGATGGDPQS
jgi:hypothetical protein